MISNYKVKVNDSCNYKVSITDIQNKYKFKLFCAGADLTDYYTKEQVDQSQNTQDILIDNILNQIPTGTATGETINITDSSSLPLNDIQVAGNTYQETTTGKNLFDGVLELGNFNSNTGEKIANHDYIINTNSIPVEELTNYKISSNGTGIRMYVFEYKEDMTYNLSARKTVNADNYLTTNSGTKYINFRTIDANTNLQEKIQVEKGSTATDWEKYTNGASPNPDYPQTISNVTGTNTIKIVGKNLFDKSNVNVLNAYFTATSPTITSSSSDRTIYIPCEPNTTYTISKNLVGYGRAVGYTSTIPAISSSVEGTINISANSASGTITTGANANYLVMRAFNTGQDTLTYQQVLASIQIEKSSTVTTYEAYKEKSYTINLGSIELCKIGDYKDRIYYSSGKWYLEKNIGKVVLDSSENWATWYQTSNSNIGFYYTMSGLAKIGNESDYNNALKCNRFSEVQTRYDIYIGTAEGIKQCGETGDQYIALGLAKTRLSDWSTNAKAVESLKAWLSSNKPIVYYVLSTPTTTEITDATLVGQLDALLNSTTYKTTTNITVDTTNQQPTLTLTYRKDLETLIGG